MLLSNYTAASLCSVALVVMAVTPYHRFCSSIGLASSGMTWLVILGMLVAGCAHGVWLYRGNGTKPARYFGVIGPLFAAIAVVPEWVDLAFYVRGDSIPVAFAPIWALHVVSCVACLVGSAVLSFVIWGMTNASTMDGGAQGDGRTACESRLSVYRMISLSCLLFCCRVSWRTIPAPWGVSPISPASIAFAFSVPLVFLALAVFLLLRSPNELGLGHRDGSASASLVTIPIGLIPATIVAYYGNDVAVFASLAVGSVIAAVSYAQALPRERLHNSAENAEASDSFDATLYSPALSPREEEFVRLLLKGKTPAEIARETGANASTVRVTLHRAYVKASVSSSSELVALCMGEDGAVRSEKTRRRSGDIAAPTGGHHLLRYPIITFFFLLAVGPLALSSGDWVSGTSWTVVLSLLGYVLGLALLLLMEHAGEKAIHGAVSYATDENMGAGGLFVWTILSALEWSFSYIAAWKCVHNPLMAVPVLFCGLAATIPLVAWLCRLKTYVQVRSAVPFLLMAVAAFIYAANRGRIPGLSVSSGVLLVYALLQISPEKRALGVWMVCFGATAPVWIAVFNMTQDLMSFESLLLAAVLGQVSSINIVVATVIVCWSAPMFITHVALGRSIEDERAVSKYRASASAIVARDRQLALLKSRSLSDVQAQILLLTAEGATTKTIAGDVGYAASTVQALRSASYRQLKIKNKTELVSFLSQVDGM